MNYELAKQLKDAGFPQDKIGIGKNYSSIGREFYVSDDEGKHALFSCQNYDTIDLYLKNKERFVEVPTFSELIEACGEKFEQLKRDGKDGWRATWYDNITEINGYGPTPEEAVAKLWLELKGKKVT